MIQVLGTGFKNSIHSIHPYNQHCEIQEVPTRQWKVFWLKLIKRSTEKIKIGFCFCTLLLRKKTKEEFDLEKGVKINTDKQAKQRLYM